MSDVLLCFFPKPCFAARCVRSTIHLVDPAIGHMHVSKIKPCMSLYKPLHGNTANGSLNSHRVFDDIRCMDTSGSDTCIQTRLMKGLSMVVYWPTIAVTGY